MAQRSKLVDHGNFAIWSYQRPYLHTRDSRRMEGPFVTEWAFCLRSKDGAWLTSQPVSGFANADEAWKAGRKAAGPMTEDEAWEAAKRMEQELAKDMLAAAEGR